MFVRVLCAISVRDYVHTNHLSLCCVPVVDFVGASVLSGPA